MRKLVSIKNCGGKTIDANMPPNLFDGTLVIHFTDGTSSLMEAVTEICCGERDAWIEELLVESVENASDVELDVLETWDVITEEERAAESLRRLRVNAVVITEERRKQYEELKAEFEGKQ